MAAKTKRRRIVRRKTETPAVGKIQYRVIDEKGNDIVEPQATHTFALVRAQRRAEQSKDPLELRIVSAPMFGEPSLLTRVVRDEDGIVHTYTVSRED